MARKSTLKKPQPLTAAIIAYMQAGEERGDAQCAGLRVRCLASGLKVFFYRCRAHDGALGEIRLGEVGPLTLSKARDAVPRKRLEREQGKDPQLEKRKEREQATLGCPCVVQDRVLNHVDSSVSAIYDQHRYSAEARDWLQKWADYLEALTAHNVVPLRAA